jgi:DNA-binding PadR family transcriptional regulator
VYALTDQGLEALREWARLALRAELDELDALMDETEQRAPDVPRREPYLLINHRLARRLIAAHRAWVDEVEAGLAPEDQR